ncbi:helix-turn-helix domain-containing protein [Bacillus sp. Bva_UNVM-123]
MKTPNNNLFLNYLTLPRLKKYHKNHAGMNYAVKLYKEGGMTVNQICEITKVSRASLYRKLSEGNK